MNKETSSKRMEAFILKTLKKSDKNMLLRSRLWRLYSVTDKCLPEDTSALMSSAIKTLLNNGKVDIVFINEAKHIKLK